jgi:GNAT superfamily N-acetyltransferase
MLGAMLTIRRATPADADALATTVAEGFASYRDFAPPGWEPPERLEFALGIAVRLRRPNLAAWIAEDDTGAAAGHVSYLPAAESRDPVDDPTLAHLEQLFVRRAHWGSGIAPELLATAVEHARAAGYATMRLATPADHHRARRFYEREGWTPQGEPFHGEAIGLRLLEYRLVLREPEHTGD